MNIRNTRELRSFAAQRLQNAPMEKRIVLIYAALILGLSALVTVVNYVLGLQIDQLGGLSNLSTRTMLSSVQSMIPIAQGILNLCLEVGYIAAMLRIARGQYASPQTLRLGFDRFWVLLRCTLIKSLIYMSFLFVSIYLGVMLYMLTPFSDAAVEVLMPVLSEATILDSTYVLDDATYAQLTTAMLPAFLICGAICCGLLIPLMYSYRMVNYIIIDHPGRGAMAALRESKLLMRGNRLHLFKLDVSLWWYYAALAVASVVCYGDMILPMLGISLPWPETVSYFLFFFLYLAVAFAIYYFLRNRADVAYSLAYDAIKPEEPKDKGVVLGNIFQM